MKRMSKVIAVAAAMIMVMAMSSSVFAVESPVYDGAYFAGGDLALVGPIEEPAVLDALGSSEAENEAKMEALLEKEFKDVIDIPEGATIDVLGAWDLTSDKEKPTIAFSVGTDYAYVYVLHYNTTDKTWELWECVPSEAGIIEVTFDNGLSPVYIFTVMKDGKAISIVTDQGQVGPDGRVSHKTGF